MQKTDDINDLKGMEIILDRLRACRGTRIFRKWFSGLKLAQKNSTSIILIAPTEALAEEISLLFGSTVLLEVVQSVWPDVTSIRIKPAPKPAKKKSPAQGRLDLAA